MGHAGNNNRLVIRTTIVSSTMISLDILFKSKKKIYIYIYDLFSIIFLLLIHIFDYNDLMIYINILITNFNVNKAVNSISLIDK